MSTLGKVRRHPSPVENEAVDVQLGPAPWCHEAPIRDEVLPALLQQHYLDRVHALQALNELGPNYDFINEFHRYFHIDSRCLCREFLQPGQTRGTFMVTEVFNAGKAGSVSYLRNIPTGTTLILKAMAGVRPPRFLDLFASPYTEAMGQMNPATRVNAITTTEGKQVVLSTGSDNFANQTCLNLVLNAILGDQPNYVRQYDAFYCDDKGYNIMEWANAGDLADFLTRHPITDRLLYTICKQVFTPLALLKRDLYGFVHGDLKTRNIFVQRRGGDEWIFKLGDFDKSSITWHGIRFYNNTASHYRLWNNPFVLDPSGAFYRLSNLETKLTRGFFPVQTYTMHSPYGFYLSYDLYTFIYSLVREPAVWAWLYPQYQGQVAKTPFYDFWVSFWYPEDYPRVMKKLEEKHAEYLHAKTETERGKLLVKLQSLTHINKTLAKGGYRLRYNLDFIYHRLDLHAPGSYQQPTPTYPHITVTKNSRICLGPCEHGTCRTNTYDGYMGSYNWDYCEK